jgi:glucan-binding YG repeat protein
MTFQLKASKDSPASIRMDRRWEYVTKDGLVPGGWTQDVWGDWHYYTSDGFIYTGWLGDMYIDGSWLIKAEFEGEYIEEKINGVTYRIDSNGHAKRISK